MCVEEVPGIEMLLSYSGSIIILLLSSVLFPYIGTHGATSTFPNSKPVAL